MQVTRRGVLASAGSALVAGCVSANGNDATISEWPSFGRDPTNTRSAADGAVPTDDLAPRWASPSFDYTTTSPIATESVAVVGSKTRGWDAYRTASGDRDWQVPAVARPSGTPTLRDEILFVTEDRRFSSDSTALVRAIETDTGDPVWETHLDGEFAFPVTVLEDRVYGLSSEHCVALDADTGAVQWRVDAPSSADRLLYDMSEDVRPAVTDETVVFPTPTEFVATNRSGTVRWRKQSEKNRAAPVVSGTTVYLTDVSNGIRALDVETGEQLWTWSASGCWTSPAVGDGRLYATTGFDLVALDEADGAVDWRVGGDGLAGDISSAPAVVGDRVVCGSISNTVVVVIDGRIEGRYGTGSRTSPAVVDGTIVTVGGREQSETRLLAIE